MNAMISNPFSYTGINDVSSILYVMALGILSTHRIKQLIRITAENYFVSLNSGIKLDFNELSCMNVQKRI